MTIWAIIPVKPLRDGKSRLSHILSANKRAQLTSDILSETLSILNQVPDIYRTLVVSRDPSVLKIARQHLAFTFSEGKKQGLNEALARAVHVATAQGATSVLILPSDLPLLTIGDVETLIEGTKASLNGNGHKHMMAICPDRAYDGTNALYLTPPFGFQFYYGPQSYDAHIKEAQRLGMESRVVYTPGVRFDLDTEEDWYTHQKLNGEFVPA